LTLGTYTKERQCWRVRRTKQLTPNEFHYYLLQHSTLAGRGGMRFDTSIRFTPSMWEAAQDYARQNNTDLSKVMRLALYEYLKRQGINSTLPAGCR